MSKRPAFTYLIAYTLESLLVEWLWCSCIAKHATNVYRCCIYIYIFFGGDEKYMPNYQSHNGLICMEHMFYFHNSFDGVQQSIVYPWVRTKGLHFLYFSISSIFYILYLSCNCVKQVYLGTIVHNTTFPERQCLQRIWFDWYPSKLIVLKLIIECQASS